MMPVVALDCAQSPAIEQIQTVEQAQTWVGNLTVSPAGTPCLSRLVGQDARLVAFSPTDQRRLTDVCWPDSTVRLTGLVEQPGQLHAFLTGASVASIHQVPQYALSERIFETQASPSLVSFKLAFSSAAPSALESASANQSPSPLANDVAARLAMAQAQATGSTPGITANATSTAASLAAAMVGTATLPQIADAMPIGAKAPAPLGYLDFCARRPEQCGLSSDAGTVASSDVHVRIKELYARYYWAVLFDGAKPSADLVPTSGDATQVNSVPHSLVAERSPPTDAPVPALAPGDATQSEQPTFLTWSGRPAVAQTSDITPQSTKPADALAGPTSGPRWVPLVTSKALLSLLDKVNLQINDAIRYVPDAKLYGVADYWALPLDPGGVKAGDCKDYVLENHRALIAAGVPAENLSIAIVRTPWGETHAVLLVATDKGELVLDSLSSWVRPWKKVHYTWIERQAPGEQLSWVHIG